MKESREVLFKIFVTAKDVGSTEVYINVLMREREREREIASRRAHFDFWIDLSLYEM